VRGLKRCPFCAGSANSSGVVNYGDNHEAWWRDGEQIRTSYFCLCSICGSTNKGLIGHRAKDDAVKHWNTRLTVSEALRRKN
jgi:hypothetical protein